MQYLADGKEHVSIGTNDADRILVERFPKTWTAPVRLNEEALGDAQTIAEEEVILSSDDEDEEDDVTE